MRFRADRVRPCPALNFVVLQMIRPALRRVLARPAVAFARGERGSLTILGVVMFMLMLVAGGIALDVMRSEVQRTEMQTAIDRGVLASASLAQTRDAAVVMRDYLRAAGIDPNSVEINAFDDGARRSVDVSATARTQSLFMDMLGVPELTQTIQASAIEQRTQVELSLVLDISGSMRDDNKIGALREAAKTFVAALLRDRADRTFISLVPYGQTVDLGAVIGPRFPLTNEHARSACVTFADSDYKRVDLAAGASIRRLAHHGRYGTWGQSNETDMTLGPIKKPACPTTSTRDAVVPWSNNVTELQARIAAYVADGPATAIGLGAKVGALLLDPSTRPQLSGMIGDATLPSGQRVDPVFAGRPAAYDAPSHLKVLVVMTDGVNTNQYDIRPDYRSGPSSIYVTQDRVASVCDDLGTPWLCFDYNPAGPFSAAHPFGTELNPNTVNGRTNPKYRPRYSLWSPSRNQYYVHHLGTWQNAPWGGNEAQRLSWPDVWAHIPHGLLQTFLSGSDSATRAHYDQMLEHTHKESSSRANTNLSDICTAARAKGVLIYTIAFRVDRDGKSVLQDCAGRDHPERYFDVQGLDIETAFEGILAAIVRLRLTK